MMGPPLETWAKEYGTLRIFLLVVGQRNGPRNIATVPWIRISGLQRGIIVSKSVVVYVPEMFETRTHLFLVYDNPISNITPALDPRFRPREVWLLGTPEMSRKSEVLARVLREAGVRVEHWPLADAWDIEHVRERILAFVAEREGDNIALNVSDGTRPMSLAAYEIFRLADKPIYYVHPGRDHVVWLHPREWPSFDLADRIKLPAFLAAHDLRLAGVIRKGIPERLSGLKDALINKVSRYSSALGVLNYYAALATERARLTSIPMTTEQMQRDVVCELLELFSVHGLLRVDPGCRLVFSDEDARFYVNGGWLEEHVFGVVNGLRLKFPTIQDLGRSLVMEWDVKGSPVTNELDVAFLADNRLHLIECKTKRFDKELSPESQLAATLYKLDTLRDYLGGDGARAMLVSYRSLDNRSRMRASEFGINICDGQGIQQLESVLVKWIGEGKGGGKGAPYCKS